MIYYLRISRTEIWMLTLYGKNVHENIPAHVLKQQEWEQGRREPGAAAQTLIRVAEKHPKVLRDLVV